MPVTRIVAFCPAEYVWNAPEKLRVAVLPTTDAVPLVGMKSNEYAPKFAGGVRPPPSVIRTESKENGAEAEKLHENEAPFESEAPKMTKGIPF